MPPGLYRGEVEGAESGRCEARIEIGRIPGGCLTVDYEAVGADGVQHVEHTVVAPGALHVAHSEASGVAVFTEADQGVFDGPCDGPYVQRLVIAWDGQALTWSWHWSPAGESPRSSPGLWFVRRLADLLRMVTRSVPVADRLASLPRPPRPDFRR